MEAVPFQPFETELGILFHLANSHTQANTTMAILERAALLPLLLVAFPALAQTPVPQGIPYGVWSDAPPGCVESYTINKDRIYFNNKALLVEDDCKIKGFSTLGNNKYSIKTECVDQSGNSDKGISSTFVVMAIDADTIVMTNVAREMNNQRLKRCGPAPKTIEAQKAAPLSPVQAGPWHPSKLFAGKEARRAAIREFMGLKAVCLEEAGTYSCKQSAGNNAISFQDEGNAVGFSVEYQLNTDGFSQIIDPFLNRVNLFGLSMEDIKGCNNMMFPQRHQYGGVRVICMVDRNKVIGAVQGFFILFEK